MSEQTPTRAEAAVADAKVNHRTIGVKETAEYVEALADFSEDFLDALATQAELSAVGEALSPGIPKNSAEFVAEFRVAFNTAVVWSVVNGFMEPTEAAIATDEQKAQRQAKLQQVKDFLAGKTASTDKGDQALKNLANRAFNPGGYV